MNVFVGSGVWYYESKQQLYRGEWHLGVARCGSFEDMPAKVTKEKSHFLPRIGVRDPEGRNVVVVVVVHSEVVNHLLYLISFM